MSRLLDYSTQFVIYRAKLESPAIPLMPKLETPLNNEIIEVHRPLPKFNLPSYYIKLKIYPPKLEKYSISEEDDNFFQTVSKEITIKNFERFITLWEFHTSYESVISLEKAIEVAHYPNVNTVINIYGYWTHRRKYLGSSLLRTFWKSPNSEDSNLAKVFCRRKNKRMKLRQMKERETGEKLKVKYM